nr:metal-sensitive transcriptional regulator [Streptomyces sp. TSRI0281]
MSSRPCRGRPTEGRCVAHVHSSTGARSGKEESMAGYSTHKQNELKRLRRIEGQVRGLQRMVEEDTYCVDVLTQVAATTRALQSFALQMLDEHMDTCVRAAVAEGGEDGNMKLKEAGDAIARLVRS